MAMNKKLETALNKQINKEFHAAYGYLAMSAYLESTDYPGFAKWMKLQSQEEVNHAMKIYGHMIDRNAKVVLDKINQPKVSWKSPLEVAQSALKAEQDNTAAINEVMGIATKEKDYPVINLMEWFVDEQVEEETNADALIQKFKRAGKDGAALLMLDEELGKRTSSD